MDGRWPRRGTQSQGDGEHLCTTLASPSQILSCQGCTDCFFSDFKNNFCILYKLQSLEKYMKRL